MIFNALGKEYIQNQEVFFLAKLIKETELKRQKVWNWQEN